MTWILFSFSNDLPCPYCMTCKEDVGIPNVEMCPECVKEKRPACYCKKFCDEAHLDAIDKDTLQTYSEGVKITEKWLNDLSEQSILRIDDYENNETDLDHIDYKVGPKKKSEKALFVKNLNDELRIRLTKQEKKEWRRRTLEEKRKEVRRHLDIEFAFRLK